MVIQEEGKDRMGIVTVLQEGQGLVAVRAQGNKVVHRILAAPNMVNLDSPFVLAADATVPPVSLKDGFQQPAKVVATAGFDGFARGIFPVLFAVRFTFYSRLIAILTQAIRAASVAALSLGISQHIEMPVAESRRVAGKRFAALSAGILCGALTVATSSIASGAVKASLACCKAVERLAATHAPPRGAVHSALDSMKRYAECVRRFLHAAMLLVRSVKVFDLGKVDLLRHVLFFRNAFAEPYEL